MNAQNLDNFDLFVGLDLDIFVLDIFDLDLFDLAGLNLVDLDLVDIDHVDLDHIDHDLEFKICLNFLPTKTFMLMMGWIRCLVLSCCHLSYFETLS